MAGRPQVCQVRALQCQPQPRVPVPAAEVPVRPHPSSPGRNHESYINIYEIFTPKLSI